jgi:hypothetical protein
MPTCRNCSNSFPNRIKIDGLTKILSGRRFCLNCSPYGQHNTKQIDKLPMGSRPEKFCNRCETTKNANEFYRRRKGTDLSPYCKPCTKDETKERYLRLKMESIEYLGGKCQSCGYSRYYGALEFHHLDPLEKEFTISQRKFCSLEKIKKELDKCVLVCSVCHREIEAGIRSCPDKIHI